MPSARDETILLQRRPTIAAREGRNKSRGPEAGSHNDEGEARLHSVSSGSMALMWKLSVNQSISGESDNSENDKKVPPCCSLPIPGPASIRCTLSTTFTS